MKNATALAILLLLGFGILLYVAKERKKISEDHEKAKIVENLTLSTSSSSGASSSVISFSDFRLRILSDPDKATIYLDDQKMGTTPTEMPVPATSKKLRLEMEGYESYTRQIPALRDTEGDLVWKIQLKKTPLQEALPANIFAKGSLGPFLLQLKATPLEEFNAQSVQDFKDFSPKYCKVMIDDKAWVRVLVGPFAAKAKASRVLKALKEKAPQAFVTQKQKCL